MKNKIFIVVLMIIAAVVAIPLMSFASRQVEKRADGDTDMLQENNYADNEENDGAVLDVEVNQLTAVITPYDSYDESDYYNVWELSVTLENGEVLSKIYDYGTCYVRDPEIHYADLMRSGKNEIVLVMPNATSNYASANVHVLQIQNNSLKEVLTILDCPHDDDAFTKSFKDSLFIIPHIAIGEELPYYTPESYETFCTGAEIAQTSEGDELWVRHIMKDSVPYSIIRWSGDGWYVAEQGINLSPNSIENDQTEIFQKNESIALNFREENIEQNINMINESKIAETYSEYYFEDSKFIIFKNVDDDENAHSGVIINEKIYDFGEVCMLLSVEQCTITTTDIYGVELVKITGILGAAYAPSEYYCIDSNGNVKSPRLVLRVENYNNKEIDLDSDGVKEVFERSMFASLLHRYDANSQKFYVADLIADTGAMQVAMDDNNLFIAFIEHGEVHGIYKYSEGRLSEITPPQTPDSSRAWMEAYAQMIAEEAEKMSTDISRITFIDVDFDGTPEMFFSRGGYNIPIYRGFSYKNGKLIDIVILDEAEGMPAFLELYRENSTQKLLWFAMNTLKDGLAYYDTIWNIVDFSDFSTVNQKLFFGWNELYTGQGWHYRLYMDNWVYGGGLETSLEQIEKKQDELFSKYEKVDSFVLATNISDFISGNSWPPAKDNISKELILDFLSSWGS